MKTIRFGIIGGGLMGREFASAAARWMHLVNVPGKPEIVALCDKDSATFDWYRNNFASIRQVTEDYRALLSNPDVEAVYIAVPHNLHREIYCAAIEAGKHLMGEKPFGIDLPANQAISAAIRLNPQVFARCSSESPFFPGMQKLCQMLDEDAFGQILEASTGFLHSSDLDPDKAINWKRIAKFNGEYGVLGDLGMHALHVPFRASWQPRNVRAILSNIVKERMNARGELVACDTWDNGVLLIETAPRGGGDTFPWTVKLQRIAPGHRNTWYTEILGTRASVRWSSESPQELRTMRYTPGARQAWEHTKIGYEPAFKAITGSIFEFGFCDSILQMWAAFIAELVEGKPRAKFLGCVTPDEAAMSHRLFTAALESQAQSSTVPIPPAG